MPVRRLCRWMIAEDIDFAHNPDAEAFRTRLRAGLASGPNFAGKYAVVSFGCGVSCQNNMIVNVESGRVIGEINTNYGAQYNIDSALLVANEPDLEAHRQFTMSAVRSIGYFVVENDQLKQVLELEVRYKGDEN
jgi:hypothetical protein